VSGEKEADGAKSFPSAQTRINWLAAHPFVWPWAGGTKPSRSTRVRQALQAADGLIDYTAYDVGDGAGGESDGIIQPQELVTVVVSDIPGVVPPGTSFDGKGDLGGGASSQSCRNPPSSSLEGGSLQVGGCGFLPGVRASFEVWGHELGHVLGQFKEGYEGSGDNDRGSMMGSSSWVPFGISSKYMDPALRQVAGWQAPRVSPLINPGTCELIEARHVPGVAPIMLYDQRRGFSDQFYIEGIRNVPLASEPVSDWRIDDSNDGSGVHLWYASHDTGSSTPDSKPDDTWSPYKVPVLDPTDSTMKVIKSYHTVGPDGRRGGSALWGDESAQTLTYHDGASARLRFRTSSFGPYAEWGFRRLPPANVFVAVPPTVESGEYVALYGKFGISRQGDFPRDVVLREYDGNQFQGYELERVLPVEWWSCDIVVVDTAAVPPGMYQAFVREEHEYSTNAGVDTRYTHGTWALLQVVAGP